MEFAPLTCLPGDLSHYRYEGSLTTEPFNEFVSWVVLRDKVAVKAGDPCELPYGKWTGRKRCRL